MSDQWNTPRSDFSSCKAMNDPGYIDGFADGRRHEEESIRVAYRDGYEAAQGSIAAQLSMLNKQISDLRYRNIELQGNKVDGDDRFDEGYARGRARERELIAKWLDEHTVSLCNAILQGDHCGN